MIKQPNQMDFSNQKFSMIIYGAPGVGKSTLAASAPKPILFDLDKGIRRVKAQHRPLTSVVDTFEELLQDLESPEVSRAETIIIDTGGALITLLQDYVMRKDSVNKTKSGTISQKGFGAVKAEFTALTNKLKTVFNKNIIYVFHSVEEKDKDNNPAQRLLCEGSAKNIVWQPCDFGAYIYKSGTRTYAGFTPTDEYFAKGCYGVKDKREIPFGDAVKNDFLSKLFEEANSTIANEADYFAAEKQEYEKAMEEGIKLVDAVNTLEDVEKFSAKLKAIAHKLTSFEEIKAIFSEKIKELGIKWDVTAKKWVQEQKDEIPNDAKSVE